MPIIHVSTLTLVFLMFINQGHSDCIPGEEGKQHHLKCLVHNHKMGWRFNDRQVSNCENMHCNSRDSNLEVVITNKDNQFESRLKFKKMERKNKGKWTCSYLITDEIKEAIIEVCDHLEVYAKPVNVTCDQPVLVNSNTNVSVTCRTDKIYPQAGCQFYKRTNKVTGPIDITNTITQNEPVYYRSQCTLTLPVTELGEGSHTFIAKIYPNVTGGPSYGVDVNNAQPIQLSLPTAALDPECLNGTNVKDGYIKKGETVKCKCKPSSTGNPPGTVEWKDRSGTDVLTIDNANSDQSHTCVGSSVLGLETPGVNYSLKLAYGPVSVTFGTTNNSMYDHCTGDSLQIPGNCQVVKDQVNPAPNLTVTSSDGEINEETRQTDPVYGLSYTFKPRRSGHLKVKCLATNTKFEDFLADGQLDMEVRAPPTLPPVIGINNMDHSSTTGDTVNVTNGDVISCHVEGGHPLANVTLSCDSDGNNTSSDTGKTQLTLDIGQIERKMNCTCIGSYGVVLKCPYSETTVITLLVSSSSDIPSDSDLKVAVVIGSIVGGVFLIVLGAVIYCLLKRKKKSGSPKAHDPVIPRSEEVNVPNEIYSGYTREQEIVTPNDIYAEGLGSKMEETVVPNEIYGKGPVSGKDTRGGSIYQDYTSISPSITSACAAPRNMKTNKPITETKDVKGSPYDDVITGLSSAAAPKPKVPSKPSTAPKPAYVGGKDAAGNVIQPGAVGETYATVNKPMKAVSPHSKPKPAVGNLYSVEDFYPNQKEAPEIPVKLIVYDDEEQEQTDDRDTSNVYANKAFETGEEDCSIYKNISGT